MGELQYDREILKGFFAWKMETCLKHFDSELHAEEVAQAFALNNPKAIGYITFKSEYRGKIFYWIDTGDSYEIDAVLCYLQATELHKPKPELIEPSDPNAEMKKNYKKLF